MKLGFVSIKNRTKENTLGDQREHFNRTLTHVIASATTTFQIKYILRYAAAQGEKRGLE